MDLIELPSPNFDDRKAGIDILLLHYTGMQTAQSALDRLCDEAAQVSAHYVIDEEGLVYRLVAEEKRAWHAGASSWKGARDINARPIGIEIVNPGHEFGYRAFPLRQMEAVADLAGEILARHAIPSERVLGHSDVAPLRKEDPGELFDWHWLAGQGVGFWAEPKPSMWSNAEFERRLTEYGYDLATLEARDAAIVAFARHFRPANLAPKPDAELKAALHGLIDSLAAKA
jgi:N-acetylmuramoyl-L-alanine amidase